MSNEPIQYLRVMEGDESRSPAQILLMEGSAALGGVALAAEDLDSLIQQLGALRQRMAPSVPGFDMRPTPDTATANPMYAVRTANYEAPDYPVLLAMRDPGLGHLFFAFTSDKARSIGKMLIDTADAADALSKFEAEAVKPTPSRDLAKLFGLKNEE